MTNAHTMPHLSVRAIDHVVLPVDSLATSRERFARLGFQVQEERVHPFGTSNACIHFSNDTYIEPLGIADREGIEAAIREGNRFAARQDAYRFRHGEGFAMFAMRSKDAAIDQAVFVGEGYASGSAFEFERLARLTDGTETKIGFRLAYATDHRAPDTTLFTCEHLNPDQAAPPECRVHDNGAVGITSVIMSEPNPTDFQYYLQVLTGQRSIRSTSFGIEAEMDGGSASIVTPRAMAAWFGDLEATSERGVRLRAFSIGVEDLVATERFLTDNDVGFSNIAGRLVVPPEVGQGAILAFEQQE